ncbi:hypothetical protein JTF04_02615 [Mammaliicoccus vitulinus]|uniref:hypothetical protein n=1 Tax=Mammaliicoccus vitulinus TaxID=71237 RepID=UPI00194F3685|nr:hypothetical protein [Mammaliicoccus vitulinus]MBM6628561.1 hypothetical protein [Mammaliicoccus vitulinus]
MIQRAIKNILQGKLPDLEWTVDYHTAQSEFGVVYYEGGYPPDRSDMKSHLMNYQVEIRSESFDKAANHAWDSYNTIHGITSQVMEVPILENGNLIRTDKHYVQYIYAESPPIRVGVINDNMIYTINFLALILPYCE